MQNTIQFTMKSTHQEDNERKQEPEVKEYYDLEISNLILSSMIKVLMGNRTSAFKFYKCKSLC